MDKEKDFGISNKTPLYVIGFNKQNNELIVGEENELYRKEFLVSDINFFIFDRLTQTLNVEVKTRYSTKAYKAVIAPWKNNVKVIFDEPQKAITSGQSAVFYIDDVVIGGGK